MASKTFARRLRRWLLEGWPLWMSLMGIVVPIVVAAYSPAPAAALRSSGVLLQALGLALIIFGFDRLRRELESPGYVAASWKWLKQFKRLFRAEHHLGGAHVVDAASRMSGHGSVSIPNETVDQRLERLEKWRSQFVVAMQREHEKLRNEIVAVERTVKQSETDLRRAVKDTHLGGLNLELVAIVWLMVGMVLATLPDEVSARLGM